MLNDYSLFNVVFTMVLQGNMSLHIQASAQRKTLMKTSSYFQVLSPCTPFKYSKNLNIKHLKLNALSLST